MKHTRTHLQHLAICTLLAATQGACTPQPEVPLTKAVPLEKEVKVEYVEVPSPQPLPGQMKPIPVAKHTKGEMHVKKDAPKNVTLAEQAAGTGKDSQDTIDATLQSLPPASGNSPINTVVAEANAKASFGPEENGFINSMMVYNYMEGALYQLYAAPQHITSIMLQPGEKLMSVASGDTVRWVVNDIMSGSGDRQKVHVLIKPVKPGLTTNILITTDQHIYNIEAHSDDETYMASLSWNYPQDTIIRQEVDKKETATKRSTVDTQVQLADLNFSYAIEGKKTLPWKPKRVFDDGLKTYIEFPESLKAYEAPVLFISTSSHATQLVNYRKKGNYYIVDRLFDKAELRTGEKKQEVVTIHRTKGV